MEQKVKYICIIDGKEKIIISEIDTAKNIAEKVRLKNTKSVIVKDKNRNILNHFSFEINANSFLDGIMYAAQFLTIESDAPSHATDIIKSSGFRKEEVVLSQKSSGHFSTGF
jgi:hypothetical protein